MTDGELVRALSKVEERRCPTCRARIVVPRPQGLVVKHALLRVSRAAWPPASHPRAIPSGVPPSSRQGVRVSGRPRRDRNEAQISSATVQRLRVARS
jgi:DNA-directed RNA polymerase subunit RPC12/RpoP